MTMAIASLLSCSSESEPGDGGMMADAFSLTVKVPGVEISKAADDALHEATVKQLHLFFFREEGFDEDASEYVFSTTIDEDFEQSSTVRVTFPDNALKPGGLFGVSANSCRVYAVANVDADRLTGKTVAAFKATGIDSKFDETAPQDCFAMDGAATVSLNRDTRTATGLIELQRAAAKLSLSVDVEPLEVVETIRNPLDGTETQRPVTYTPNTDDMHVWIINGVKNSLLNTSPIPSPQSSFYSNETTRTPKSGSPFILTDTGTQYRYLQEIPFYSYPNIWDAYSPTGNTSLVLMIPWSYTDDNGAPAQVVTYYNIAVNPSENNIFRNTHYLMCLKVSRLGGITMQEPVDMTIDWTYEIEWNEQQLDTDIKEIKYLLMNNNDFDSSVEAYRYTMNNQTSITIPYSTSHPVEIVGAELSWFDYSTANVVKRTQTLSYNSTNYKFTDVSGYDSAKHYLGASVNADKSVLELKRDMVHISYSSVPSLTSSKAISEYTITIKLRHIGATDSDPSANLTVVVNQIPPISITAELNDNSNGYRFVNNNYERSGKRYDKSIGYVTTIDVTNRDDLYLGSIHSDKYVSNKNNYILTISRFEGDEGKEYIIADPRSRSVDNLNNSNSASSTAASWSYTAKYVGGGNSTRKLSYYYPASPDTDKTRLIAPKLCIASQWGVTYDVNRMGAKRRCASYQENGRPAGRWRLPTIAEIEYICGLSCNKFIPFLFGSEGDTADYWCASGAVEVDNGEKTVTEIGSNSTTSARAVRCVYDEWFWEGDVLTNKNTFTWGDRARNTGN